MNQTLPSLHEGSLAITLNTIAKFGGKDFFSLGGGAIFLRSLNKNKLVLQQRHINSASLDYLEDYNDNLG